MKKIIITILITFLVGCSSKVPKNNSSKVLCSYKDSDSPYSEVLLMDHNTDEQKKDLSKIHILIKDGNSSDSIPVEFVNPDFLKEFLKKCTRT